MDLSTTRNETIRALAAASAAEIRSRSDRALRAHAAVAGEIVVAQQRPAYPTDTLRPRTTDRPLPLERTSNRYTGAHRDEVAR